VVVWGLATKQVDYTLVFAQAELNEEAYIECLGFEKPGMVYKLHKSDYSL